MGFTFVDNLQIDLVINGKVSEKARMASHFNRPDVHFDPGLMRPWIDGDGARYCDVQNGRMTTNEETGEQEPEVDVVPLQRLINAGLCPNTFNATSLPRHAWERIDRSVIKASRDRLKAWADMREINTYGGFDGMATWSITRERMTDPGQASISMDNISAGRQDRPQFDPDNLPLPIVHAGFQVSERQLAVARNNGLPLTTDMAEACAVRVAETIEQMTIGTLDVSGITVTGSSDFTRAGIYGYRTQPGRITKTDITASASFVASTFVDEVLTMKQLAKDQKFHGPFILYYATNWDEYLNRDYWRYETSGGAAPTRTVRQRVEEISDFTAVKELDLFTNTDELLLVCMRPTVIRAINGMEIKTVQWVEHGGSQVQLRVMAIQVPDVREQFVGTSTSTKKAGVVHGTTS